MSAIGILYKSPHRDSKQPRYGPRKSGAGAAEQADASRDLALNTISVLFWPIVAVNQGVIGHSGAIRGGFSRAFVLGG